MASPDGRYGNHWSLSITGARRFIGLHKPKVFRDTAVTNLHEFFERFRSLSVRSDADLELLVDQAQQLLRGVEPQTLRQDQSARQQLTQQLSAVQGTLDELLVDRPRRNLIRFARQEEPSK